MTTPPLPAPRLRRAFKVTVLFLHQWLWVGVFFVPFSSPLLLATFALAFLLVMGVEMGHHRYFSHRSFRCGRVFQFVLGVWATAAFQRDILWWASMHRLHHRYSDAKGDPHTPYSDQAGGFWHAYINWGVDRRFAEPNYAGIRDLLAFPELRWLGRWHYVVNLSFAAICYGLGASGLVGESGAQTFVWLYVVPLFITQQMFGLQATVTHGVPRLPGSYQPFDAGDRSLNHVVLGFISTGGGFHNNHHRFPGSARLGLRPFEIDTTYLALRLLQAVGVVHRIHVPPDAVRYAHDGGTPRG